MLESIVARVLNNILGKYVEELDAEGLNVGIFSGDVLLHGLKLKPSCLFELELPIEVVCGVIGELRLVIPWSCLAAKPIKVIIEDVLIVAHPVGIDPFDANREKQLLRALKARVIDRIERGCKTTIEGLLENFAPLLSHTVQLHVRGVHVRYEGSRSAVSAGLLLQEVSVETTNSKWKPTCQQSGSSTYQLMRLEALALYINTGLHSGQFVARDNDWIQHMRNAQLQFQVKGAPLDFAVKPLNAKLKVIVGRGDAAQSTPLLVDVVIQDAVVSLSHRQLVAVQNALNLFHRIPLYRDYLPLRPQNSVKSCSADWWRYAYKACLQQRVIPYTWARLYTFRRNYRDYKELYKLTLLHPADTERKLDLQRSEDTLPISSIVIAREQAKIELRNSNPDIMEIVEVGPHCRIQPIRRSKSFEQETFSHHTMDFKLNMTVDNMSVSLVRDGREMLCLALTQGLASVESHGMDAWKASARAGSLLVEGASADNELMPILATPANTHLGTNLSPCFSLDVEKKPLDESESTDWAVNVSLLPMELIYQEHAFSEILTWLPDFNWSDVLKSFRNHVTEFASKSLVPRLELHAAIALPVLVLPEAGSIHKSGLVVVIDLGNWTVETDLQPRLTMEEVAEMTQMELEERLYHRLQFTSSGAQILFTDSGEEWRDLAKRDESDAHILSHLRTNITLSSSIKPDYALLPRVKLNIGVPTVHVALSERRCQQLLDVIMALPTPKPRKGLFTFPEPRWPVDRIKCDTDIVALTDLSLKVVSYELSRQRTPDSLTSPMASSAAELADLQAVSARSVISDTSEEELELWARTVDLPGFEDNVSPNNTITALVRVTVGEFVCHLPRSIGFQDKPYLMLRLARLSLDVALMQYGPAAQIALGGFQLIDKLHIAPSGEYLEVVSTQSDVDMFTLLYRKVRADCPDFKSHFHSVEQSIVADIGRIALVLQRDACLAMYKFIHDFYKRISMRVCYSMSGVIDTLYKCWMSGDDPPIPAGGTKYSNSLHMAQFSMRLREADVDLMHLQAGGLEIDGAYRINERLVLRMFLRNLTIDDMTETTLYSHVLSQDEEYVLEAKLVRLGPAFRRGLACGTLKISLARLHVLVAAYTVQVMQRFVTLLSSTFIMKLQAILKNLLSQLPDWEGALQLALSLHLPTVLLPPGSSAPALLIANLGDLTVENFLKYDSSGNLVDNVLLRLENLFVTRGLMTLSGSIESREEVLEPIKISIDAKRVLSGMTFVDVTANVDTVHVGIGQKDLSLLTHLYIANKSFAKLFDCLKFREKKEPVELRSLQAFLRDGNAKRRDCSLRLSMDSFVLTIYIDMDEQLSSPVRDQTHALCKLHVQDVICQLDTCVSGTCELRLSVHNCFIDDARSDPSVVVKRIFGPRPGGNSRLDSAISVSSPPLVDVVGKQNERGDQCVDVMVERTRLSLSAGFLAALAHFWCDAGLPDVIEKGCDNLGYVADTPLKTKHENSCCSEHILTASARQRGLSLSLQLRRPEVALLADGGAGLVMRCELLLDTSQGPGRDELVLRMVGCRVTCLQPAPVVLIPCDLELVRKLTTTGVQVAVGIGAVDFTFCSVALSTCNSILEEIGGIFRDRREKVPRSASPLGLTLISEMWTVHKMFSYSNTDNTYKNCPWFVPGKRPEVCSNEPLSFPLGIPFESLSFAMGTAKLVLGVQKGVTCRPMFIAKGNMKLFVKDGTSAPALNGCMQLEVACWNSNLMVWESLLEPWTITLELYQNKSLPISPCSARATRTRRSDETVPSTARDGSESSGDESDAGMTFLKPEHFHLDNHRHSEVMSEGSDSECGEGTLERLRSAVAHLFVDGVETSDDSEGSSDEVETDSASSDTAARSPTTERAVFLNKHCDSIDSGLEAETVDRQSTHVIIQASPLELTVTPNTLSAMQEILSQRLNTTPPLLTNHLGTGTHATLFKEGEVLMRCGFDEESPPSTPGSPSPCSSPFPTSSTNLDDDRISPDFSFDRLDLHALKGKLCKTKLLLEVPGVEAQSISVSDLVGVRKFDLTSSKQGQQYTVVLLTKQQDGVTYYIVSSPYAIKNNTSYPIAIYYKKTALECLGEPVPGESSNPFDEMVRLVVVAPDDCYYVPLTVCFHCKLYFVPAHWEKNKISENGISWHEIKTGPETMRDILCGSSSSELFAVKAKWNISTSAFKEVILAPAWTFKNFLPCACEMVLSETQRIRLEAGEESNIYVLDPKESCDVFVEVPEYMGQPWSGVLALGPDCKEKLVVMETEKDTDGGNKHLAVSVLVTRSVPATVTFFAPYWLLNKTGLPLQIRSSGSDVIQEWSAMGPLLFSHRKHRARTVRVRVLSSSWSPAFSLDSVGCSGLAVCRDSERKKKYRLVVNCTPCHVRPDLCRIVTFSPYFIVENASRQHFRFMEDNERADLWHDISAGQCVPFWPDTDSLRMVVRQKDSKHVSAPFPMAQTHTTALRMDKCLLTVAVTGGEGMPMRIKFRFHRLGDPAVRIENHCGDLFLKFRQSGCSQVALIPPYHELLYTWDDPCRERQLLWSVYNNAGGELNAVLSRDACGEERISFRTVRTSTKNTEAASSSPSSDSDTEQVSKSPVRKHTRKDTVVVYWTSFLEGRQRVLHLTQDERLARKTRKAVEAERTHLELYISLASVFLSLANRDSDGVIREIAYGSVRGAPARWELCAGQRWKPLPLELAAWLENSYISKVAQPTIKDCIQVDIQKMQMTRPLFGALRRRPKSAIAIQYRLSRHLSVLLVNIHRVQLDDQRLLADVPCILRAAPSAKVKPALEVSFLWRRNVDGVDTLKFGAITVQEHTIHLESDWLGEVCDVLGPLRVEESAQSAMRRDIAQMHSKRRQSAGEAVDLLIEDLYCSEIKLDVTLVPSSAAMLSSAETTWCVPNVLVGLASSVSTAPAPIANLPIKLCGINLSSSASNPMNVLHNRISTLYFTQLLQQLFVLVQGVNVLATPTARLATRVPNQQEEYQLPEEFSYTVRQEFESRLTTNIVPEPEQFVPPSLCVASRAFPLGCGLGLSGLAVRGPRGPPGTGMDAFGRGPGRTICSLIAALQSQLTDPLTVLTDAIARCEAMGANVSCRVRPPRYISPVAGVRPYSMFEAQGLSLLLSVCRGRYCKDIYWAHAPLTLTHSSIILISLQRVLLVEQIGNSSRMDVSWSCPLNAITVGLPQDGSLLFTVTQGLEVTEKVIKCWEAEALPWLHARISEALLLAKS